MVTDFLAGSLLFCYGLLIGPLGFLRGPLLLERLFFYLWVLLPQGLLSRGIRIGIDWRFGHFDAAIVHAESLITQLQHYYQQRPASKVRRLVLLDLFSVLARAYLHIGHIDDAMQVVIRANQTLGVDRIVGLAQLDAKTAHLVRAGIAAGKILGGNGVATMFVKTTPPQQVAPPVQEGMLQTDTGAKIILFPKNQDV